MKAEIFIFLPIVLFISVATLSIIIFNMKRGSRTNHLGLLGEELGVDVIGGEPYFGSIKWLSFIKKPLRISGEYQGAPIEVWHFSRSSGKSSNPYIGLRMTLSNSRGLSFQFHKEGFFSKIGKTFGMQDVSVGDPRFDKRFIVKCSDPDFIRVALLPEIKDKFYDVFEKHGARGSIKLKDNEIYYEEGGRIRSDSDRARFAALIDLCIDLRETVRVYNEGM